MITYLSDEVYLRMNVDAKLFHHTTAHGIGQGNNLGRGGSAQIDEHQGLLVVHGSTPHGASLPSTLFDHPSGRDLHAILNVVVRHVGILALNGEELIACDNGIHEEAASIALLLWVR